tara:strand:+ start:385 stop:714 length:330 start_codon:yes stop_codon:yes gene_type:complete
LRRLFSFRISLACLILSSFSRLSSSLSFDLKSPFYALAVSDITDVISIAPVSGFTTGYFLYLSGGAVGVIDMYSRFLSSGGLPKTLPVMIMSTNPAISMPLIGVNPFGI